MFCFQMLAVLCTLLCIIIHCSLCYSILPIYIYIYALRSCHRVPHVLHFTRGGSEIGDDSLPEECTERRWGMGPVSPPYRTIYYICSAINIQGLNLCIMAILAIVDQLDYLWVKFSHAMVVPVV